MLQKDEEIIHYQGCYLHIKNVNMAKAKLTSYLKHHEDGISLAQYRDLLLTNRKMATLLLEYFDFKQITVRRDNVRYFTTHYKKHKQT